MQLSQTSLVPDPCIFAGNKYCSRYSTLTPNPDPDGEEEWLNMVAKFPVYKKFVSINKMIDHIFASRLRYLLKQYKKMAINHIMML